MNTSMAVQVRIVKKISEKLKKTNKQKNQKRGEGERRGKGNKRGALVCLFIRNKDIASAVILYLFAASITIANNSAKRYATHEEMKKSVSSDSLDHREGLLFNLFLEKVYISTLV